MSVSNEQFIIWDPRDGEPRRGDDGSFLSDGISGGLEGQVSRLPRVLRVAATEQRLKAMYITRKEAIARIRKALWRRSDRAWSVRGGTGTAYGWIDVIAPPRRCDRFGNMTPADCATLANLFGRDRPVHHQGLSISPEEREYYVDLIESGDAP